MERTLGGGRLGAGNKNKVTLHGFQRSNHNLGYLFKTTMAAGTLVPFISELGLPGDTFDIDLDSIVMTHPTVGPLFGSYKAQYDVFMAPIRLYHGKLHNNPTGIGLRMDTVKFPVIKLKSQNLTPTDVQDLDNAETNPSCILRYLGIAGTGLGAPPDTFREFNGLPWLMYWDIYKNYYANKQEDIGAVIHTPKPNIAETIDTISVDFDGTGSSVILPQAPGDNTVYTGPLTIIQIAYTGTSPNINTIQVWDSTGKQWPLNQIGIVVNDDGAVIEIQYNFSEIGALTLKYWNYGISALPIQISTFGLDQIDLMRDTILQAVTDVAAFSINAAALEPWSLCLDDNQESLVYSQEGLGLKTYQSDLFNNWLKTDWISGPGGINELTKISTASGGFTLDQIILQEKMFNVLNRIAIAGGTYEDWQDANWAHERFRIWTTPMYQGGLIKEVVFEEVVSNSLAPATSSGGQQPLGTLAGKGRMARKHKGGKIIVKCDEPCYIMGICSLTPRIDNSQGNKWDVNLKTMDDLHKPGLDGIGFQDLSQDQMAWWSTAWDAGTSTWKFKSAGKQMAWTNYTTNVNRTFGEFAVATSEMFMTLNRRYEINPVGFGIKDMTTYIDPSKYNNIFAVTKLDTQNFWMQISVDITARRKMAEIQIPNL